MQIRKSLAALSLLAAFISAAAQDIPVDYSLGENYSDRYKYSTLLSMEGSVSGETVLVRTYYAGFPLRAKGHFIEIYDADLNLKLDYNYKSSGENMVDGFVKNGQLYLLELVYDVNAEAYSYIVHQSAIDEFNFSTQTLLSIPSKEVANPLAVNKYSRNFGNGFSTATHFNDKRTGFAITVHYREGREEKYKILLFGTDLKKHFEYDFTQAIEETNYAFENVEISNDMKSVYLMGKAYFKKRRTDAKERRFQYELVKFTETGHKIQNFSDPGRFAESLKPIITSEGLKIVGFYADRKDNRYNGLVYFNLDPNNLEIKNQRYNPFSNQFMLDKFGREVDAEIKNLIFKSVHITSSNAILFSAEEYFVSKGEDISDGGTRITDRYHYNDIVVAKLNASGSMEWARNINKTEVTQGDASYASYAAYGEGEDMYLFINSGENPRKMSNERILFKQGYSRNPNMFVIKVNAGGDFSYKKLIDDKEVRLPIMVSRPQINTSNNDLMFYAKRGTKKQLIKVHIK